MKQIMPKLIEYLIPALIAIFSAYMTIQVKTAVLEATVKEQTCKIEKVEKDLIIKTDKLETDKLDKAYFDVMVQRLSRIEEKLDRLVEKK